MHRIEGDGLIVSCDFCATDWDGDSAVIEGHRGAVLCLPCLDLALERLAPGGEEFKCVLCLRERIPVNEARWAHPNRPETYACQSCVHQAADVMDRDSDIDWKWKNRPV
jgi:hypothetical protein